MGSVRSQQVDLFGNTYNSKELPKPTRSIVEPIVEPPACDYEFPWTEIPDDEEHE